jgi:hypothetical protein
VILAVTAEPGRSVLLYGFDAPQDIQELRESLQPRADVREFAKAYADLERSYLLYLRSNELGATFGTKMADFPKDCVLPIFQAQFVGVSGLTDVSKPDKRHADVYAVGDIGYIEFIFGQDGQTIAATVTCFRPDATFVPLKSTADISRRLEWDKQKLQLVESWLKARLAKDLRKDEEYELAAPPERSPSSLEADIRIMWRVVPFPGKNLVVSPVSAIHAADRVFSTIIFAGMTRDQVAQKLHTDLRSPAYPFKAPFWPVPEGADVFRFDAGGFGLQFTLLYGGNGMFKGLNRQVIW